MQPMFAVTITFGRDASSARSLFALSSPASFGCRIEYVPAEPQHVCASATGSSECPTASRISSTWPRIFMPCCSVHGEWNATRCGPWSIATSGAILLPFRRDDLDRVAREVGDPLRLGRVGGIVREEVAVVLDHDAAAARGHDDGLDAVHATCGHHASMLRRTMPRASSSADQVMRQRAAAAAAGDRAAARCRCGRARARSRRRCSASAPAARSLPSAASCARAAARATRRRGRRPECARPVRAAAVP